MLIPIHCSNPRTWTAKWATGFDIRPVFIAVARIWTDGLWDQWAGTLRLDSQVMWRELVNCAFTKQDSRAKLAQCKRLMQSHKSASTVNYTDSTPFLVKSVAFFVSNMKGSVQYLSCLNWALLWEPFAKAAYRHFAGSLCRFFCAVFCRGCHCVLKRLGVKTSLCESVCVKAFGSVCAIAPFVYV